MKFDSLDFPNGTFFFPNSFQVITSGVLWLLNFQTSRGSFVEVGLYRDNPLHLPMKRTVAANATITGEGGEEEEEGSLALTAHVLITLEQTMSMLKGSSVRFATMARQRAAAYLERQMPNLQGNQAFIFSKSNLGKQVFFPSLSLFFFAAPDGDSYALCLVAYALALSKSSAAGVAYDAMMSKAREEGGMVYWARDEIKTNRCIPHLPT